MPQNVKSTEKPEKRRVAVFFGGRSPEHDVSVVSGLQILKAIDQTRYDAFPVYITPDGDWLVGDILRRRDSYMLDGNNRKKTTDVTLDVSAKGAAGLIPKKSGMFGAKPIEFDVAVPSFHGLIGEDGGMQGLFETAGIAYAGMRTMASSVLMDKVATKYYLQALDIPVLPFAILHKPLQGYLIPPEEIRAALKGMNFPCIIKPSHLGSSIGVAKVESVEDIEAALPAIFEYDSTAIVEPFVQNMVEYNVAAMRKDGKIITSAFERPKAVSELLDFKQKYLSGGDNKSGSKNPGDISQGMLSLTRELNPKMSPAMEANMRKWVKTLFAAIDGTGAPRIDFIGDAKSGDIWMNEVNPWPGSIGYFLWEAAEDSILFTGLMSNLIEEAWARKIAQKLPKDPVPVDARLFKRAL